MELNYLKYDTEDEFDYIFRLVGLKLENNADLDWEEIVRLTNLDVAGDTLRKAMQPKLFGSYWVYKRLKDKGITAQEVLQSTSLIPKSHLTKLTEVVGDYNIRKRGMELERLELAKAMREATPNVLLVEQFRDYLETYDLQISPYHVQPRKDNGKSVIKMLLSDVHIGAEIDEEYNKFNWDILTKRTEKYIQKVEEYARIFGADIISLTIMGALS